ncbi:MAG: hypothetical protein JF571_09110 [Asticcacaulis sp.]|nr:hypothetical protein [Asticcacaulis sp.]
MALGQDIRFVVSLLKENAATPAVASDVLKQFLHTYMPSEGRFQLIAQLVDVVFARFRSHRDPVQLGYELTRRLAPHVAEPVYGDAPAMVHG